MMVNQSFLPILFVVYLINSSFRIRKSIIDSIQIISIVYNYNLKTYKMKFKKKSFWLILFFDSCFIVIWNIHRFFSITKYYSLCVFIQSLFLDYLAYLYCIATKLNRKIYQDTKVCYTLCLIFLGDRVIKRKKHIRGN